MGRAPRRHPHPSENGLHLCNGAGGCVSHQSQRPAGKIYHVGENFVEEPGSVHEVSANASDTEPARLLAVFVLDTDEKRSSPHQKVSRSAR
jgi:quercetin dioxygenase-like cupin family protein